MVKREVVAGKSTVDWNKKKREESEEKNSEEEIL